MIYRVDGIVDAVSIAFIKDDREWYISMDYMDKESNRLISPFSMYYKDANRERHYAVIFDGGNELHIDHPNSGYVAVMSEEDAEAFTKYGAIHAPELPF